MKKIFLLVVLTNGLLLLKAQKTGPVDSLADYEALFNDFASFIDSLMAPRSFATINVGVGYSAFEYPSADKKTMLERTKLVLSPSVGYYHKSGFGVTAVASLLQDAKPFTWYQTAATASYDYLKNRKLLTGLSFTHFFTRDSLAFYTSPLSNQVNAYVLYRKWWLKPALAAAYGWGSITSVEKRTEKLKLLKRKPVNTTTITETTENIADLSFTASVKHDFYWRNVLSKRDYFRVTPQLIVTSGTQRYGLAQTNNFFISEKHNSTVLFSNSKNSFVAVRSRFQALSLSGRLRTEFSKGVFFIQPQLLCDYYFPDTEKKLSAAVLLNAGILF